MNFKLGEKHIVQIIGMGENGEGIGKVDGFTFFVVGGVIGDTLNVKIDVLKKNYAIASIVEVIKESEYRQDSDCGHFPSCGGCQLRHINYDAQLMIKKNKVKDTLIRIGGIDDVELDGVIGMENPFNYRNKCQFPVSKKSGTSVIGFYRRKTHEVEELVKCHLHSDIVNDIVLYMKEWINKYNIKIYNEKTHKGLLRHIVIRESSFSGDIMLVVVINGDKLPFVDEFIVEMVSKFPNIKSIILNKNTRRGNTVMGFNNKCVYGKQTIMDTIGHLKFEISPLSFFQINNEQTVKLYNKVMEYAQLDGTQVVYDIYCGIGSISLFLAERAKHVYGIEIVDDAIKNARENAIRNGINNATFITAKAEDEVPKMYDKGIIGDVVVVDPPRKGCEVSVLDTIIKMNPERVVYVSCKVSTLARDLKYIFENSDYKLEKVEAVDMFPFTGHVETVVLLSR